MFFINKSSKTKKKLDEIQRLDELPQIKVYLNVSVEKLLFDKQMQSAL